MSTTNGKIVTFYSFKGGVGRTMALANAAFIATMNGQRVLVMDWDLEAPGLAYYFRSLLDPAQAKVVKDAKGVLNIFSEWIHTVEHGGPQEVNNAVEEYVNGKRFRDCVVSLMPDAYLEQSGGALDYISAGSRKIQTESLQSYEEVLSSFSWQNFFEHYAGGAILDNLRQWSKANYDIVLIDSRTGLADVAGICTMQLPDEVLLCFTLNRQNIDGVSKIAGAIRHKREERVKLRAIPMRTARVGTSEESDARARALSSLSRVGGFSLDALQEDFKLAVRAAEGVPFYETLAPLLPQTPEIEVFSANYRQLASVIVGHELSLPELPFEWMEMVRRRMQPRNATIEYIAELQNGEPFRAAEELERLLEGALEEALEDGELDDAYVEALTEAAFWSPVEFDSSGQTVGLGEMALDLLRALYASDRGKWSLALVDGIEKLWINVGYSMDPEQQLNLLYEADSILADSNTLSSKIRRLDLRRSMGRIQAQSGHNDQALQHSKEAWSLSSSIKREHELTGDQLESVFLIESDLHRLEGEVHINRGDRGAAVTSYQAGLNSLDRISLDANRTDAARQKANIHARLSRLLMDLGRLEEAAQQAVAAADWSGRARSSVGSIFTLIAEPVIALQQPGVATTFGFEALVRDPRAVPSIATYAGRNVRATSDVLVRVFGLASLIGQSENPSMAVLQALSRTARLTLSNLGKRRGLLDQRQLQAVLRNTEQLIALLSQHEALTGEVQEWHAVLQLLVRPKRSASEG